MVTDVAELNLNSCFSRTKNPGALHQSNNLYGISQSALNRHFTQLVIELSQQNLITMFNCGLVINTVHLGENWPLLVLFARIAWFSQIVTCDYIILLLILKNHANQAVSHKDMKLIQQVLLHASTQTSTLGAT